MVEVITLYSTPATIAGAISNVLLAESRGDVDNAKTFQVSVAGTGSVSAVVDIEVSNDGVNFLVLATATLNGTTSASDGFVTEAPWASFRANLKSISGTGAAVQVNVGK